MFQYLEIISKVLLGIAIILGVIYFVEEYRSKRK